jgi:hypothetical protein
MFIAERRVPAARNWRNESAYWKKTSTAALRDDDTQRVTFRDMEERCGGTEAKRLEAIF